MKARLAAAAAIPILFVLAAGCGPSDPTERVLHERARWQVALESWALADDGTITLSARVSGPVRSELDRLTVRILFLDAEGNPVGHEWWTLDVSGIERGGPEDVMLRLASRGHDVDGLGIDPVANPDPDEIPNIPELRM